MRKNKSVFVSVPGHCFSVYDSYKSGELGYYIFDDNKPLCDLYDSKSRACMMKREQENYVFNHVKGIIPIMYEYALGVRKRRNCLKTIPLPIDCDAIEYKQNNLGEKVVIMHGIIREKDKGTDYILKALEIVKSRHPNEVEIIVEGKKPLKEYLNMLYRVNILVDQCKEHCYGMNALYAMAEGRVVLGGASDNSLREFGIERDECPVIHITPNVDDMVQKIESLLTNKEAIPQLGLLSRKYVEKYHDCKKIAKMYLDEWGSVL